METDLLYTKFNASVDSMIAESHEYERLKEEERKLTTDIQETNAKYKKL